jgi:hypothetical protein
VSRCVDYAHGLIRFLWMWLPVPRAGTTVQWNTAEAARRVARARGHGLDQSQSHASHAPADLRAELLPMLVKRGLPAFQDLFAGAASAAQTALSPSGMSHTSPDQDGSGSSSSVSASPFSVKSLADVKQAILLQTLKVSKYVCAQCGSPVCVELRDAKHASLIRLFSPPLPYTLGTTPLRRPQCALCAWSPRAPRLS